MNHIYILFWLRSSFSVNDKDNHVELDSIWKNSDAFMGINLDELLMLSALLNEVIKFIFIHYFLSKLY